MRFWWPKVKGKWSRVKGQGQCDLTQIKFSPLQKSKKKKKKDLANVYNDKMMKL